MGSTSANDMAYFVRTGEIASDVALYWHLTSNHYPPLPSSLIPTAQRALKKAAAGLWKARVLLPAGATYKGKRTMQVSDVIDWLHLESFLECEEDD